MYGCASVYNEICKGGVHKAPNIKTAEASKIIENIQRDLNIALINELALIFHRLGIYTREVIEAAGTKWNFHKYQPGLVGGHCIGVDPYYLTYHAQEIGYDPDVILAGRHINDRMAGYVADLMIKGLIESGKARVLVMGLTFKEDIRDTRNSKIDDTIKKLQSYGVVVCAYDPNLQKEQVEKFCVEYIANLNGMEKVDGIIFATLHQEFKKLSLFDVMGYYNGAGSGRGVLVDIKSWFLREHNETTPLIYKCL